MTCQFRNFTTSPDYVKDTGFIYGQKYSRLRCLLCVKGLVICFYLGWSGSILQSRQSIIKVGSKSWLLTCSSNITLSLPSYTGSAFALKRELIFCNGYISQQIFELYSIYLTTLTRFPIEIEEILQKIMLQLTKFQIKKGTDFPYPGV